MLRGPVWVCMDWDMAGGALGKTLWICSSHPARPGPAAELSLNVPFAPALPKDVGWRWVLVGWTPSLHPSLS